MDGATEEMIDFQFISDTTALCISCMHKIMHSYVCAISWVGWQSTVKFTECIQVTRYNIGSTLCKG